MSGQPKIKVLHIIPTLHGGGAERLLVDLLRVLDRRAFEPVVLVFKEKGFFYERLEALGIRIIFIPKKRRFDPANFWGIYQAVKAEKPDIVHTHLGGDIYGRLSARWAGTKVIVSTEHNINRDEGVLVRRLKRYTARFASVIIAVSKAVRADALRRYGLDEKRVRVIYNGIDIKQFAAAAGPEAEKNTADVFRIGSAGRLVEQKNFSCLIEAVGQLAAAHPDISCSIAGEGALRPRLEAQIKNDGLEKIVALPGLQENVPAFLQSLDVFVLPSAWEGLGLVVLEAGAAGIPVIASNVDGIRELIEDGRDGRLFNSNDPAELAAQLAEAMSEPEKNKAMAAAFAKKISREFSIEGMAARYEELYKELWQKTQV